MVQLHFRVKKSNNKQRTTMLVALHLQCSSLPFIPSSQLDILVQGLYGHAANATKVWLAESRSLESMYPPSLMNCLLCQDCKYQNDFLFKFSGLKGGTDKLHSDKNDSCSSKLLMKTLLAVPGLSKREFQCW
jgi:hypothetical protein